MIVTKKLWLSWPIFGEGTEGKDFESAWVPEEPKNNNGILEKGEQLNCPFANKTISIDFPDGPEFTLKEFVGFIKDGTLELEETDK